MKQLGQRQLQIGEVIKRDLSVILGKNSAFVELSGAIVLITQVEVSKDVKNARVYVHSISANHQEVVMKLNSLSYAIKAALAKRAKLRHTPSLQFYQDSGIAMGTAIDRIVASAQANYD